MCIEQRCFAIRYHCRSVICTQDMVNHHIGNRTIMGAYARERLRCPSPLLPTIMSFHSFPLVMDATSSKRSLASLVRISSSKFCYLTIFTHSKGATPLRRHGAMVFSLEDDSLGSAFNEVPPRKSGSESTVGTRRKSIPIHAQEKPTEIPFKPMQSTNMTTVKCEVSSV